MALKKAAPQRPERWAVDAGERDVARLDIPADLHRDRQFEISCLFMVTSRGDDARHALKLLVDGAQQWSRRVDTHPGPHDSLETRFRRVVPAGVPLRLTAITEAHHAARLRLTIVAEEDDGG
jgi:hypothetical protein